VGTDLTRATPCISGPKAVRRRGRNVERQYERLASLPLHDLPEFFHDHVSLHLGAAIRKVSHPQRRNLITKLRSTTGVKRSRRPTRGRQGTLHGMCVPERWSSGGILRLLWTKLKNGVREATKSIVVR
jgi:hypothetical protein